jgi:hypothetical protein
MTNMTIYFGCSGTIQSDKIELKQTKNGGDFCAFSLATGDGESRQYLRLTVWDGELARRLARASSLKDVAVHVTGSALRLNRYNDRDGKERVGLQAMAHKVERIETKAIPIDDEIPFSPAR